MKRFFTKFSLAGALAIGTLLAAPGFAQDDDADRQARMEERRQMMEQRRAEFLENNPDAAARMEERRQRREEFLENNPDAAARMGERRERMREHADGERPQRPRPEAGEGRGPRFGQRGEGFEGRPGPGRPRPE